MPNATTRFLANKSTGSAGAHFSVIRGTGGTGATDAAYPLTNLQNADRYVSASLTGSAGVDLYAGFASNVSITHIGLLNLDTGAYYYPNSFVFRPYNTTGTTVASCSISGTAMTTTGSFTTAGIAAGMIVTGSGASTADPETGLRRPTVVQSVNSGTSITLSNADGSGSGTATFYAWGAETTISGLMTAGGGKDAITQLAATTSAKWWRVSVSVIADGFSLGNLFLGTVASDLGIAFSPGTGVNYRRQRIMAPTVSGLPVKSEPGRPYREFTLKFNSVPQAMLDTLITQFKAAPFTMLDAYGNAFQADLANDDLSWTVLWGAPDLYNVELALRTLP